MRKACSAVIAACLAVGVGAAPQKRPRPKPTATATVGPEWWAITFDEVEGSVTFIDRASVTGGRIRRAWTSRVRTVRRGASPRQSKVLNEVDCAEKRYRHLHIVYHGWDGENDGGAVPEPRWAFAAPDTNGYDLMVEVCRNDGVKRGFGPVRSPLDEAQAILVYEDRLRRER